MRVVNKLNKTEEEAKDMAEFINLRAEALSEAQGAIRGRRSVPFRYRRD